MSIVVKRVYDQPDKSDGYRVLVDRIWPRGVSKEKANLDEWLKEIAPSTELRKWFNHTPERFDEFSKKYKSELDSNPTTGDIKSIVKQHNKVTLVYSAHDVKINQAVVLMSYLNQKH